MTSIVNLALVGTALHVVSSSLLAAGAETGTTSVSISIDGSRLAIALTTDPETLLARLNRFAGRARTQSLVSEPIEDAIVRRQAELLRHVVVQFDDRVAQVQLDAVTLVPPGRRGATGEGDLDPASASVPSADRGGASDEMPGLVQVRFSASVPGDARTVRWTYALASAGYPLTIRQGASVTSETVTGAEPGTPVRLVTRRSPDVGRGLWALFVPAVFASLVTVRVRERRPRAGPDKAREAFRDTPLSRYRRRPWVGFLVTFRPRRRITSRPR